MLTSPYHLSDMTTESPSNDHFYLHAHGEHEIFMFMEGDSKYVVEDKNYDLSPGDIIIIKKHEMHRIYHNSDKKYRRLVLMVFPEFFSMFNCPEYENVFLINDSKIGNRINAETVHSSGLYDAIMRLMKYSKNFTEIYTPITNSIMIEILHLINHVSMFENAENSNKVIKSVIHYINNHYTEKITLDAICEKFFLSKYYLCHIFKEATGLTVHEYVKRKRLALAREYVREGKTLTEAAILSGFSDYSSFYRAYMKENKQNPKKGK